MKQQGKGAIETAVSTGTHSLGSPDNFIWHQITKFVQSHEFSKSDVKKIFSNDIYEKLSSESSNIPVSIFNNSKLSVLESVVKYMKEVQHLSLKDIASLLNRNSKTIWTTYNNASKKMPESLEVDQLSIQVPIELFQNRETSPLEVVVCYMKDTLGFKNHEIARLLNRNQRTVWTTYNRKKK